MPKRKAIDDYWKAKLIKQDFYLPNEILIMIFTYLNKKDLCRSSGVCKSWYVASEHISLWKNIDLSEFNLSLTQLWKFFRIKNRVKHVVTLKIEQNSLITLKLITEKLMARITRTCSKLKSIKFGRMDLEKVPINTFPVNLEELTLKKCEISANFFDQTHFESLKSLDLTSTKCIRVKNITSIAKNLKNSLETLILSNCYRIYDSAMESVVELLNLKHLSIDGTQCTSLSTNLIRTRLKNLIYLDVSITKSADFGSFMIAAKETYKQTLKLR